MSSQICFRSRTKSGQHGVAGELVGGVQDPCRLTGLINVGLALFRVKQPAQARPVLYVLSHLGLERRPRVRRRAQFDHEVWARGQELALLLGGDVRQPLRLGAVRKARPCGPAGCHRMCGVRVAAIIWSTFVVFPPRCVEPPPLFWPVLVTLRQLCSLELERDYPIPA
jgi:hypothetical protein